MPAVIYPAGLPMPQSPVRLVPRERRALPIEGGAFEPRNRQRDFAGAVYEASWIYAPEEMAVWRAWYEDELLHGLLRFTADLPLDGGISSRVVRYIGEQRREHLGRGIYRVSAQLEVRGASESSARYRRIVFQDDFTGAALTPIAAHTPNIAPSGFVWADTLINGNLILDGEGNALTDNPIFDAAADGSESVPPLAIALTYPYALEIRAQRGVEIVGVPEEAQFRIEDAIGGYVQIAVRSDETHGYAIRFEGNGGTAGLYSVSGNTEHIGRLVVTENEVTVFADGVAQTPIPILSAPEVIANVLVSASSESGATYRVNFVQVSLE